MNCQHCAEEIKVVPTAVWPWQHKTGVMTGKPECSVHSSALATPEPADISR